MEGEPGIGKSRLLAELRVRAEAHGDVVLTGAGAEFERDRPYGIWVDALDAYAASQAIEDRDLAGVLPSIEGEAPGGDERHRVHRAVGRLLGELAPLLLVLDDLHWADDASTELLGSVVRRGPAPGVQLALGYRTGRASPRLSATLAAPSVQVIELATLSDHECRTLAGDLAPARHAAVFRESGGNPFYALQLARAAPAARSSSSDRVASGSGVPRSVAAALVGELEALSAPARALLDAGAIAGDPFDPELAYEIAGLDAGIGVEALDELLETRLLHVTSVPRRFAFRHPLVRRAVYESTGGGWRLVAHARAAEALAARGAAAASRAHHVEQSAVQGDPAAIAVLLEAASATAPRAPATAARWFEAALRLQPEDDTAAQVKTLVALAQAQRSTGDLAHCAARLDEAIDLLGPGETDMRATLVAATAAAEHFLGRHETADRRLAVALETLPERDSEAAVTVLLAQIAGAFFTLDVTAGCALAAEALAIAQRLGDPMLIASTAAALAHAYVNAGDMPGADAALALAVPRIDAAVDDVLARHLDAVNRLAWSEHMIERDEDSIRHAARGIAVARATGRDQFVPILSSALAVSLVRNGEPAKAAAVLDEALEAAELAANGYVTSWVLTTAAHVAEAAGDLEGSRHAAERATLLVEGLDGRIAGMATARLAVARRAQGERPEGIEGLIDALPSSWAVGFAETVTRAELADGRIEHAERYAAQAEAAARRVGLPLATAVSERARAAILLARGAAAEAAALALRSDVSAPLENARSRALAGRAFAQAGERATAVRELRAAERAFDTCGVVRDRDQARRELRKLGARSEPRGPSARGVSGLEALSRREREIADLVRDRKTNRQIAAELFLSEKTVETHLRNVFAKLGAASRVDVARAVERAAAQGTLDAAAALRPLPPYVAQRTTAIAVREIEIPRSRLTFRYASRGTSAAPRAPTLLTWQSHASRARAARGTGGCTTSGAPTMHQQTLVGGHRIVERDQPAAVGLAARDHRAAPGQRHRLARGVGAVERPAPVRER